MRLNCPHGHSENVWTPSWIYENILLPGGRSSVLCPQHSLGPFSAEDSEDEKEDHKNVRQQRQAASKAASKQREMLMDDVGSEEEEQEDDEAQFQESE